MKPDRNKMSSRSLGSNSKILAACFLLIGGLFLVACQQKVENANVIYPAADYTGNYKLVAVDGSKVPATVSHDGMEMLVRSGTFEINADGTCISKTIFSPQSGYEVSRVANATYTRNGSELKMRWEGAGMTKGTIEREVFTMDNHGMIFVYSRSGRIDDSMKFKQANGCDESTATTGIKKAYAGVFDNFDSGLHLAADHNGIPIGFFTFSDSAGSAVNISTTSEHPPLPGKEGNNQVLQLDLDVKAWAGVIHNFENAAVNTWTPRDWRGFNGFSFWLYGNNTNTPLFVEILDNRNPCSAASDAEVYTYTFADNYSGWKLITVPFEKLTRKEIGNGAPNDGLGLSKVHGWAFGTLNTGGSITYYIDDFELR